jgi:hypothetical protein
MATKTNGKSAVTTNGDVRSDVQIIPLKPLDQWRPLENIQTFLFLVVREKLEETAMQDSLDRLIRDHLPILGARIEPRRLILNTTYLSLSLRLIPFLNGRQKR